MDRLFYPLLPPSRHRTPDTQMQVLCLGLSRSGTDSLRNALQILGYKGVYHGFVITARQREDCAFWVPLMRRKLAPMAAHPVSSSSPTALHLSPLTGQNIDFDSVLGNSEAVTDGPANIFGRELMDFYPGAKVILNRRRDVDAWHRSMQSTCLQVFSWPMWTLSWFDGRICWLWWNFDLIMRGYYRNDFDRWGKQIAKEHYTMLETDLADRSREYLEWSVEDGWEPLCRFLGKPFPEVDFPSGNKGGGQFEDNMEEATKDLVINAVKNLSICLVTIIATGYGSYRLLKR